MFQKHLILLVLSLTHFVSCFVPFASTPMSLSLSVRRHSSSPRLPIRGRHILRASRMFEVCHVNEDGLIEDCEVVTEKNLAHMVGDKRAKVLKQNPSSYENELLFTMPKNALSDILGESQEVYSMVEPQSKETDVLVTADQISNLLKIDAKSKVSDDILLKSFGPDVNRVLKNRMIEKDEKEGKKDVTLLSASNGTLVGREIPTKFHMHIGAGRLGMGLVLPAIVASGTPFAVVQKPVPEWQNSFTQNQQLEEKDVKLNFQVADNVYAHSVSIMDLNDNPPPECLPPQSLIFCDDASKLKPVLRKATSFSCSIGPVLVSVMSAYLSKLPDRAHEEDRPILYCCENDHKSVETLKTILAEKVKVIDCVVDRVCLDRFVTEKEVVTKAEPWAGSIVVLDPSLKKRLPFTRRIAKIPTTDQEANYLSMRKFSLVNGMHTVVAFLTLRNQFTSDDREYILEKYTEMKIDDKRLVEAWRDARIAMLMEEFGMENLLKWHNAETPEQVWDQLLDFSDEVLVDRFSVLNDTIARVLGGGVVDRWNQRVIPVFNWLTESIAKRNEAIKSQDTSDTNSMMEEESMQRLNKQRQKFFHHAMQRGRARSQRKLKPWETPHYNHLKEPQDSLSAPTADQGEADVYSEFAEKLILKNLSKLVEEAGHFCSDQYDILHKKGK